MKMPSSTAVLFLIAFFTYTSSADELKDTWSTAPNRIWIGPEYHTNRLQDWQIVDGRLECHETHNRLPVRTCHILTHSIGSTSSAFELKVDTGPIDAKAPNAENAFSGFLIGAGNDKIDYRLTALVHHAPAPDGGTLAVVDHRGQVSLRDNTQPLGSKSQWSISSPVSLDDLPLLEDQECTQVDDTHPNDVSPHQFQLILTAEPRGAAYDITLIATDLNTNQELSRCRAKNVPAHMIDGSIALVSHHGPKGSKKGHWFSGLHGQGPAIVTHQRRHFGPVLCSLYTLEHGILRMTAQMPPLGKHDSKTVALQLQDNKNKDILWVEVDQATIDPDSRTATFEVQGVDMTQAHPYRLVYNLVDTDGHSVQHVYEGTIAAEPSPNEPFVMAALTCHKTYTGGLKWNHNGIWFPHQDIVAGVESNDPDLLYFSGDQIYEGDLTPANQKSEDAFLLDYLYKWSHWCWAFGDLARDRPCITIPDDHDVYHGNLWGAGGRQAKATPGMTAQDSGGYRRTARFVNAVHRTQTSHLPESVAREPAAQDISVYFTDLDYGGLSMAILDDRQFKESPAIAVPDGNVKNGWFQAEGFNPRTQADDPSIPLLGSDQEAFLDRWARNWSGDTWMKVTLSQTPFACAQTLPPKKGGGSQPGLTIFEPGQYPKNDQPCADGDSNGWPASGRNRALRAMRPAYPFHICGDQHLGLALQYGIDEPRDAGYCFSTPAIANTWPRRWMPQTAGHNRASNAPRYTGDFVDGFGNHMTVLAASNPRKTGEVPVALHDRVPGYGVVTFDPSSRQISMVAWPRWATPDHPNRKPYEGWPINFSQFDNNGSSWVYKLPPISTVNAIRPSLQVTDIQTNDLIASLRLPEDPLSIRVPGPGPYRVLIEDQTGRQAEITLLEGLKIDTPQKRLTIDFETDSETSQEASQLSQP